MNYRLRVSIALLALLVCAATGPLAPAATIGVNAEQYDSVTGTVWQVVDATPTFTSPQGLPILPANTNAVGGEALLANFSGSGGIASYNLTFSTPGTYYAYLRYSIFDSANSPGSYGNEDSIFINSTLGSAPTSTDIYDFSTLGHGTPGTGFWDGIFHWQQIQLRSAPSFLSYTILPSDVGNPLSLQIQNRELGATLDYILLSTDSGLTEEELNALVPEPAGCVLALLGLIALGSVRRRRIV